MTAFSDKDIKRTLALDGPGQLVIDPPPKDDQIQPASVDITVGNKIFVTDRTFSTIDELTLKRHSKEIRKLEDGSEMVLYPGYTYIIESREKIKLPFLHDGETDTKSTVGRVGASCLAAGKKFSHVVPGSKGSVAERIKIVVEPYAFPIIVRSGETRLLQLRIRHLGTGYLSRDSIRQMYGEEISFFQGTDNQTPIPITNLLEENGLRLTLSTHKAFVQRKDAVEPLDLTKKDHYDPGGYWEVKKPNDYGEIVMEKDRLYLFGSKETIRFRNICGRLVREDPYVGVLFMLHFAGFFDCGFRGQPTLEFWSYNNRVVKDGQHSGRILIEDLSSSPLRLYGNPELGSSYSDQKAPRLPKIFRRSDEFE
jgi:deoxycytidine triphosphate deaminase